MSPDKMESRIVFLEKEHDHMHKVVEALEAEKAPSTAIKVAKVKKLKLKDEIENLKRMVS